jgi:hypothetical protein
MHWREDNGASIGEGLSRTSNPNARLYEIVVTFSGMRPMREQLRAHTLEDLIQVGRRRNMKNPIGWARHVMAARQTKGHWSLVS